MMRILCLLAVVALASVVRLDGLGRPGTYAADEGYYARDACWYVHHSRSLCGISAEQTPELSAFKVAQMKKYALVTGGDAATLGIGAMSDARWTELFTVMSGAGAYPKDLDYKKAYTLDFVNKKVEAAQK